MKTFCGLLCLALIAGLPASLLAQSTTTAGTLSPERSVRGHSVVSAHDPAATIELPPTATYVGSDRWILKAYADDIELHAFADADAHKRVRRLYWVQFEAYLPSRPELKHTYDSQRHTSIGGMDFLIDTWTQSSGSTDEPDSDSQHLKDTLHAAGHTLPASMMSVRLVHLMDHARKELMVIYSEDTAGAGFTAADLAEGGMAHGHWPSIEAGLIQRARQSIKVQ